MSTRKAPRLLGGSVVTVVRSVLLFCGDVDRVLAWKMQTEHLKYVDLVDLHHRFLVQISRQIARGFAWWPISLTNLGSVTGNVF